MVQKFAYFYEQILMQYKSLQIRKKSNSSVLEPILRNFHTKFLASDGSNSALGVLQNLSGAQLWTKTCRKKKL